MDEAQLSDGIARTLAWSFWRQRDPALLDYFALTFGQRVAEPPQFEALCVAEAEWGDVPTGAIGGSMKRLWVADQRGFRTGAGRELPRCVEDFDEAERSGRTFYRFPLVKFLRAGAQLTFGEAFGPELACRKLGRVRPVGDRLAIVEVELVWNMNSLGGTAPLPSVAPALDIDEPRIAEADAAANRPRD